ncbi:hypothetical protein F5B18DRAFT_667917 [Nemania serpens]|nr:hypothetical protein F5B18DRAFT_667917 [Nemania serpens]
MSKSSPSLTTKLQNIKDYSDLILECDGQEFRVHRAIVCAQSPVLAAALRGDYQWSYNSALDLISSGVSEGTSTVKQQDDIEIVNESINNTEELDAGDGALELWDNTSDRLICHSRMNFIADYYDVAALAELSSARVQEILASKWSAEQFCDLLQQSLDSTHDKGFLRMLGAEAANHIDELFEMNVFEEGSLGEGLAFYALPQCILRLREAESMSAEDPDVKLNSHATWN